MGAIGSLHWAGKQVMEKKASYSNGREVEGHADTLNKGNASRANPIRKEVVQASCLMYSRAWS